MTTKPASHGFQVEVEMDGQQHAGTYIVESGVVKVSYSNAGSKAIQALGHSSPETIARMLLRELVMDARRR